jgi:hypothetical protein
MRPQILKNGQPIKRPLRTSDEFGETSKNAARFENEPFWRDA